MNKLLFGKQGRWPRLGVFCAALAATAMFVVCNVTGVDPPPKSSYTLNITVSPPGAGTVTPASGASFESGTVIPVAASANDGYVFDYWSGIGYSNSTNISVTMDGNKNLVANFRTVGAPPTEPQDTTQNPPATTFTLSTTVNPPGSGSASPASQSGLAAGSTVNILATPANDNYVFVNWTVASGSPAPAITSATSAATTVTIASNSVLTANFRLVEGPVTPVTQYTLTIGVAPAGAGTVNPASGTKYDAGAVATVSASALTGYTFANWSGATTSSNTTIQILMDSDKSLTANFNQTQGPGTDPGTDPGTGGGGTGKKCYYGPGDCWGIGGEHDNDKTEKECEDNYGIVVDNCDVEIKIQYCFWGPEDKDCYSMLKPNDPDPSSTTGQTYLENCRANGWVSDYDDCRDRPIVTGPKYYCAWGVDECYEIKNPSAVDPNAGSNCTGCTFLENCEKNGHLSESSTCSDYKPPTEYCYWGPYNPNAADPNDKKGCWALKEADRAPCEQWGKILTAAEATSEGVKCPSE